MKKVVLAALAAALAACGGGGGVDPTKVVFTYPAASLPSGSEQDAVVEGAYRLEGAQALQSTTDPSAVDPNADGTILTAGEDLLETASSPGMIATKTSAFQAAARKVAQRVVSKAIALPPRQVQPAYDPSCILVSAGAIEYRNCTETVYEPSNGIDVTATVNGSLTRSVSDGVAVIGWALTVRLAGSMATEIGPVTFSGTSRFTGNLTIGAATIVGASRSDVSASASAMGYTDSQAVTHLTDYDLTYQAGPFCLTGGTLQVRRVHTDRPAGQPAVFAPDVGVTFYFGPSCGDVEVAWSFPGRPAVADSTVSCAFADWGTCSDLTGPITSDAGAWLRQSCVESGGAFASGGCSPAGMVAGYCAYDAAATGLGFWFTGRDFYATGSYDLTSAQNECSFDGGAWQGN